MPKRVFISYRREDTAPAAGRVYDRLCRVLPKADVFFDVTTIGGGEIFDRRLLSEIERSDAVLVVIGRKWLEGAADGSARLFAPDDYVRAELRVALARPILVLPVLVDGARMPRADELPEDVRAITTRNALPLRHESFDHDTENVVATVLGGANASRAWDDKGRLGARIGYTAAGLILAGVLLTIAAIAHFMVMGRPLSASIGEAETSLLLIAGAILGGCLGLACEARWHKRRLQPRT